MGEEKRYFYDSRKGCVLYKTQEEMCYIAPELYVEIIDWGDVNEYCETWCVSQGEDLYVVYHRGFPITEIMELRKKTFEKQGVKPYHLKAIHYPTKHFNNLLNNLLRD